MRKYLNRDFYQSFSEFDRGEDLKAVTKDNYSTNGGNPAADKVFLLSIEEVIKYFGDSGQIEARYTYVIGVRMDRRLV